MLVGQLLGKAQMALPFPFRKMEHDGLRVAICRTVTVEENGATWFRPARDGKGGHRYLVMSREQAARVREAIVQLSIAPPAGR